MKFYKTGLLLSLMLGGLLAGGTGRAQPSPAMGKTNAVPPALAIHPFDFAAYLNLSSQQKTLFDPVMLAEHQKLRAVFQDRNLTRTERWQQLKSITDNAAAQMRTILTPDQFQKWFKMQPHLPPTPPPPMGTNAPAAAGH